MMKTKYKSKSETSDQLSISNICFIYNLLKTILIFKGGNHVRF